MAQECYNTGYTIVKDLLYLLRPQSVTAFLMSNKTYDFDVIFYGKNELFLLFFFEILRAI